MSARFDLWWRHARIPLAVFIPLAIVLATTRIDRTIAHALFFEASSARWIGAGNWWTNAFLHTGGRWAVRGLIAAGIAFWIAAGFSSNLRPFRRPAAYFALASLACIGIVGLLKTLTNVHCPWDLAEFGGAFPYVPLLGERPAGLQSGQCFPAAHAGSGYALFTLYFVLRERTKLPARLGLALGILTGIVFGIAQQSRGAHFVSHDLWSAFIAWMTSLTLYAFAFQGRLWGARISEKEGHEGFFEQDRVGARGTPGLANGLR